MGCKGMGNRRSSGIKLNLFQGADGVRRGSRASASASGDLDMKSAAGPSWKPPAEIWI